MVWKVRTGVDVERGERTVDSTLALWFHICMAVQACKSTFLVWPDANRAPMQVHELKAVAPDSVALLEHLQNNVKLCVRS